MATINMSDTDGDRDPTAQPSQPVPLAGGTMPKPKRKKKKSKDSSIVTPLPDKLSVLQTIIQNITKRF